MSWRNRIPWRWIIRGTCLGLLGMCVGLWGSSYFYDVSIRRAGSDFAVAEADGGMLDATYFPINPWPPPGWAIRCQTRKPGRVSKLHLLDGDFLGFYAQYDDDAIRPRWAAGIPLWSPTVLLAVVSWIAWRKTGRGKPGRGFPIEPHAERSSSVLS